MLSLTAFAYASSCTALLLLGGLILWREPKSPAHRYFAVFTLFMVGWLASLFLYYYVREPQWLTSIGRFNFAAIAAAVTSGYFFTLELLKTSDRYRRLQLAETALLIVLSFATPLISAKESQSATGELVTHFGPLFFIFVLHIVWYIGAGVIRLIQSSRHAPAERRAQLDVVVAGFLLSALTVIVTNVVMPVGFSYFGLQEVGALSVVFLIGAFAYAIVFQGLFDIRFVIKRTVIFTGLIGCLIGLYGALALFATQVLRKAPVSLDEFLFNLLAVAVVGLTSESLRQWIAARTDHWLFQKDYEQQAIVAKLNQELSEVFDLDKALDTVLKSVCRTLHLTHGIAYAFEPADGGELAQKKVRQLGYHTSAKLFLNESEGVTRYFTNHVGTVEVEHLDLETSGSDGYSSPKGHLPTGARARLISLGVAIAVPIHQSGQLAGLLLLGKKRSGSQFTHRDLAFLSLIAAPTLSAIQKAKLYEGDQTKTEFVSIAAHELLTPIAGIQGYMSMILDEGLGKVDTQAKGYLSKANTSANRLSELVKDLLSVSRIESGKMKFEPHELNLEALIHDAIDQVAPNAKTKGLSLIFETAPSVPTVYADGNRLMEVLINLIGNAIKYTPNGSVTVSAKSEGKFVKVAVKDTGLGMTPEAQQHLFKKFYRVRTSETESIAGTGLGLYVTKSILVRMGATITVISTPKVGSTFEICLPAAK